MIFTILLIFNSEGVLSQQVMKLKNGKPYLVNIKSPSADTLTDLKKAELCDRGRVLRNTGFGFDIGGAVVTGLGLALLIPAASEMNILGPTPDWAHDQLVTGAIVTAIGAAGLVTGVILTIAGSAKMKKYSTGHKGISLDFNGAPGQQGLSLVYRF